MPVLYRTLSVLLLLLPAVSGASHQGQGRVTMTGQLLASACSIHTDDVWQEVDFGTHGRETRNDAVFRGGLPVTLRLVNCSLEKSDKWQWVTVTFDGDRSAATEPSFAVRGEAKGIALQMQDTRGHTVHPGEPLPEVVLSPVGNRLDYRLNVVETKEPVQEGDWTAFIRFMVEYQ
ncbi:type 1 fimbrial protein [Enterobacter sp. Acro-832]|uniref:fimbrial protein n=1 Tax=Enterobacter sp. Acro-832 TaxID=2608348 RepID=UPI0014231439|nr:fimbrial protein [Enterobacter sp. Acro-832]NIG46414.1 type 1 fimbrial protein [Enterobacter sp. Acro-832]